jgi:hypothetical protein
MANAKEVVVMKWTIPWVLLCGLLVSMCVQAHDARGANPRWAIVLTITDPTTGALLEQGELDSELEFDDPIKCKSILARVGPIPTRGNLTLALTCRKVDRKDAVVVL